MDNKKKTGRPDRIRISTKETYELSRWAKKLSVTPGELMVAIDQCGSHMMVIVRQWIKSNTARIRASK